MKIKMHSIKSAKKRLYLLGNGAYKRWHASTSHNAYNRSKKQKRRLRKATFISKSDCIRLKKAII